MSVSLCMDVGESVFYMSVSLCMDVGENVLCVPVRVFSVVMKVLSMLVRLF